MKRIRLGIIATVIALSLAVLSSCSTVGALFRANISGLPYWYYNPTMGAGRDMTAIVCEGSGTTLRQAELAAYEETITRLSDMLGYRLGQESYRELSVLGTITQYGVTINDRFETTAEGKTTVYLQVLIDSAILDAATSDETRRRSTLSAKVEQLVLAGDEYVKNGMELKAVQNYMKAMAEGFGEDFIDDEYGFGELYPVVMELLSGIDVSIESKHPETAGCTVYVARRGTFVSSAVNSAEIRATYKAVDTRGTIYDDFFVYVTDQEGLFSFNSINNSMVRTGEVVFSLNLGAELEALASKVGEERISDLRALIDSKTVSFDYYKVYQMGSIATAVIEHDIHGYVTGVTDISEYIASSLFSDGSEAMPFYAELDEEEDVLYEFLHSGRTENCLLVVRMGVTDVVQSRNDVCAASAEGIVVLYSRDSEVPLYRSEIINASAFAATEDLAVSEAFKRLADIALSLIKAVYV